MTAKRSSNKGAPSGASARNEHQWRSSPLGWAANTANFELKRVVIAAREFGIDTSAGSFVGDCWQAGVEGYENAKRCWMAGDDAGAARFVVYASACIGLAARDSSKLVAELNAKASKRLIDARHAADRAAKERGLEMYRSGAYRSKDAAAVDIAPKLGRAFQTVRKWLRGIDAPP